MTTHASHEHLQALTAKGLEQFQDLQGDAVRFVAARFHAAYADVYERFGARGREATREDLAFHLEFLRPVLEFGVLQPMVDYLCWLDGVLTVRAVPVDHLALSLEWLAEFFETRMKVPHGARVAGALRMARAQYLASNAAPVAPSLVRTPWDDAALLEEALLAGNQPEALALMNRRLDHGASLVDIELCMMQPALYRIGERWQANAVSVAQEHMATAMVQSLMTVGLLRSAASAATGHRVLLACVAGNNHAIGLRMVADAFQLGGWEVQYLGANVPTPALLQQVEAWRPHLVGLSVSFAHHVPVAKSVMAQLVDRLGPARPAVMIGGLAINRFDQLAGMVGADSSSADAATALVDATRRFAGGAV